MDRVIGDFRGGKDGALVIIMSAVHGNEQAGVKALKQVFNYLDSIDRNNFCGRLIGLVGNVEAAEKNLRFIDTDLNRMWEKESIYNVINKRGATLNNEEKQQREIIQFLLNLHLHNQQDFLFFDLHTTSAKGGLFTITNTLKESLKHARSLCAPVITNVCNVLKGTTLQYFQDAGLPAIGFESGQHDDPKSVERMIAAIFLALESMDCYETEKAEPFTAYINDLKGIGSNYPDMVAFSYRHAISDEDKFKMNEGYSNFQNVEKGEILASDKDGEIAAPNSGMILMPLYQPKGDDGFFIVEESDGF